MILVFGETGQLATALGADPEVRRIGRAVADLRDPQACAALIETCGARAVINAAAYTQVDQAESARDLAHRVNAETPAAMARAAAARGLPFVHVSTDYVFDGCGARPWREDDPTAPATAYGQSKLAGETAIRAAGGVFSILRTAWVFSATGQNFLKTMLRLSEAHSCLRIVDDQIGGPTPADDLARACLHLARHVTPKTVGIYHYSGGPPTSWADFAAEIFRQSGRTVAIERIASAEYPTPAPRPLNSVLDCRKIATVFGLAQPDWRDAIHPILTQLKDQT